MPPAVFHHPAIAVQPCEFGWGVFATRALPTGTMVERAPLLLLDAVDTENPPLNDYVFTVTFNPRSSLRNRLALVLGWGSLYNHADTPNVQHHLDMRRRLFEFVTTREVSAGEQLFVSYGDSWWADRAREPR